MKALAGFLGRPVRKRLYIRGNAGLISNYDSICGLGGIVGKAGLNCGVLFQMTRNTISIQSKKNNYRPM